MCAGSVKWDWFLLRATKPTQGLNSQSSDNLDEQDVSDSELPAHNRCAKFSTLKRKSKLQKVQN